MHDDIELFLQLGSTTHAPSAPPVSPMCAAAPCAPHSPSMALHSGFCPPTRRNPPPANAYAGHTLCQDEDFAASQWPTPATRRQNTAASVLDDACASRAPSPQFSTTPPALPLLTPALPASYLSTPFFVIVSIILRNNFQVSAYHPALRTDQPVRPAQPFQIISTRLFRMKPIKELNPCRWIIFPTDRGCR